MTVTGNKAYVADRDEGFQVIDISVPTNQRLTGTYDNDEDNISPYDVKVAGNYAYITDVDPGLVVVDLLRD